MSDNVKGAYGEDGVVVVFFFFFKGKVCVDSVK